MNAVTEDVMERALKLTGAMLRNHEQEDYSAEVMIAARALVAECEMADARIIALETENAGLKAFAAWASSGDTGLSSECLARHMLGLDASRKYYGARHPLDAADFGRCYRLLEAVPAWKDRISEMGVYSPEWDALAKSWDDISGAYASGDRAKACELIRAACTALGRGNG